MSVKIQSSPFPVFGYVLRKWRAENGAIFLFPQGNSDRTMLAVANCGTANRFLEIIMMELALIAAPGLTGPVA